MGFKEWAEKAAAAAPVAAFDGFVLRRDCVVKINAGKNEEQPLAGVTARVESGSDIQSRVTATRLLAIGVFAFAAKKKKGGEAYLTIEGPDFFWTAEVDRKKRSDAVKFAGKVNDAARALGPAESDEAPAPVPASGGAAEVARLAELHSAGHLSDDEFQAAKMKALGL